MKKQVCTLVGLTSYDGYQLAAYFAKRGFEIALICKPGRLFENFKQYFASQGVNFHSFHVNTDQPSYIENAIRRVRQTVGETDVLIYNDTIFGREMNYPKYGNAQDIRLNSEAALRAVNEVSPYMARSQKGMIFFCGQEFMPQFGSTQNNYTQLAKWLTMKVSAELESRNIGVYSVYQQVTQRVSNHVTSGYRHQENHDRIRKSKTIFVYDNEKFYLNENWLHHNQNSYNEMYPTQHQQGYMYQNQHERYGYQPNYNQFQNQFMQYNYPQNYAYQNDEMYWNGNRNWQYENEMYGAYSPYPRYNQNQHWQMQMGPWQSSGNFMNPYNGHQNADFQFGNQYPRSNRSYQYNDAYASNRNWNQHYPQYGQQNFDDVEAYWQQNFKSKKNKQHNSPFEFENNFLNLNNEMFEESISYS